MPSLFDPKTRDAILDRIAGLAPDRKPLWGRFTAPEMVCHVSCDLRHGLGELETAPPSGPLSHAPLNWLAIHVIPVPKGKGRDPPEIDVKQPSTTQLVGAPRDLLAEREGTEPARISRHAANDLASRRQSLTRVG